VNEFLSRRELVSMTLAMANNPTPVQRQFTVTPDDQGTIRITNNTTNYILAALTRREAKQLSRELRRTLKNGPKS
jgi:hypothetical protein